SPPMPPPTIAMSMCPMPAPWWAECSVGWFTPQRAGLATLLLAALVAGPALAAVREDLRACQGGYHKRLGVGFRQCRLRRDRGNLERRGL
ncbi:MAG: hypothetical protein ACRDH5_13265, partial [bacterium]